MDGMLIFMFRHKPFSSFVLFSTLFSLIFRLPLVRSGDAEALLSLRASIDKLGLLKWGGGGGDVCKWEGVKECLNGRVEKLVVERVNLSGTLDGKSLNQLDQLRVLSFKENSLTGLIPELPSLANLKSLYLNNNHFSGRIPASLALMHRLKIIVLSGNALSGQIPQSFVGLSRLYVLFVQDNRLTGAIPHFNQSTLRFFNVSNNLLSGRIPLTESLLKFNESCFIANVDLCGKQVKRECTFSPSASPSYPVEIVHHKQNKKLILIPVLSVIGLVILCIIGFILISWLRNKHEENGTRGKEGIKDREEGAGIGATYVDSESNQRGFSWDQGSEGLGSLTFLGPGNEKMNYTLEDLLKASAETLGRGTLGSTYKAVMQSGYILTVKRLKDSRYPTMEEFRRHVEILGGLRHPNLVPMRAYFQAKEERLLVYDYFPNGSLFSLVHGSRAAGGSKPLHWTSCLKIAEDVAAGLLHLHHNPALTHGNLKSTNVLLGSDFESCLTDYGLTPFRNPDLHDEPSSSALFYRAPECRDPRRAPTQKADVYSYGILILELLTGKTPYRDFVEEYSSDIPGWVRSVRDAETESSEERGSGSEGSEEKINALLEIAVASVCLVAEDRPEMGDVVRMIREVRVEASNGNGSESSQGRWSDTIHSLQREERLTM